MSIWYAGVWRDGAPICEATLNTRSLPQFKAVISDFLTTLPQLDHRSSANKQEYRIHYIYESGYFYACFTNDAFPVRSAFIMLEKIKASMREPHDDPNAVMLRILMDVSQDPALRSTTPRPGSARPRSAKGRTPQPPVPSSRPSSAAPPAFHQQDSSSLWQQQSHASTQHSLSQEEAAALLGQFLPVRDRESSRPSSAHARGDRASEHNQVDLQKLQGLIDEIIED
eukprot:TRINITY_DN5414_c0_g1_i1.p1 TRINITY_DN5414_c0_g1~~TRINITY_DN5414_c0_g1_i1.p1  ORF type:complete len:226 (-),score=48.44 TRINITY_DN5414_c0_g1_i1:56-733(-)